MGDGAPANNERAVTGSTGRHWGPPLTWQQGARGRGREDAPREGHLKGKACTTRASGHGIPASRAARITQDPGPLGQTCASGVKRSGLGGDEPVPAKPPPPEGCRGAKFRVGLPGAARDLLISGELGKESRSCEGRKVKAVCPGGGSRLGKHRAGRTSSGGSCQVNTPT